MRKFLHTLDQQQPAPKTSATIDLPQHLLDSAQTTPDELKTELALLLHQQQRLSLEQAVELAGLPTETFQHLIKQQDALAQQQIKDAVSRRVQEIDRYTTEFLAGISHDIRTPLTVISGYAELLLTHAAQIPTEKQKSCLLSIKNTAQNLFESWSTGMDIIHIDQIKLKREALNLKHIFDDVLTEWLQQWGDSADVEFESNIPSNLPPIWGDKERISQILHDLIAQAFNALRKFDQGTITFKATHDDEKWLKLSIAHTGDTISSRTLERLHHADMPAIWRLSHTEGRLGVSQCLIKKHGGHMQLENQGDGGSRVNFTLPLYNPAQHQDSQP